jgi:hypothetical protein
MQHAAKQLITFDGTGQQTGPLRPDWGPNWADLQCDQCDATWTGPIGEPCHYCTLTIERMRRWQTQLTLKPPDIHPDDTRYPAALHAWGQRLHRAITAQLITHTQARNTYQREANRARRHPRLR